MIERLEAMLANGQDNALLRFSLGNAYLERDPKTAAIHFECALRHDPEYSAAWKLLGRAYADSGDLDRALTTYVQGTDVAKAKGDMQAAREMEVFARRLRKQIDTANKA